MQNKFPSNVWLVFFFLPLVSAGDSGALEDENTSVLADLPLAELLSRKKMSSRENSKLSEGMGKALPLAVFPPEKEIRFKGLHTIPGKKTFHEEDRDEDKGWMHKKKEKHKIHDILNTSITALSYLAFGGYLLCMIVGALREKRRRFAATLPYSPTYGSSANSHLATVLQQYLAQRPVRIKFPAVTFNQHGGKKRRRRSDRSRLKSSIAEDARDSSVLDIIQYAD